MEKYIKDFEKSDAPQFKGKSKKKRAEMAVAAKLQAMGKKKMEEAQQGDAVDTITMDIPLFLRMLEFAREDASQDMDLHDVTEKANLLTKDRGILSMNDYNEIVGAAEEIKEAFSKEYDNDPALKGGQKKLPDSLQQAIIARAKKKMEEIAITVDYTDPNKKDDILNVSTTADATVAAKTFQTSPAFKGTVKVDGKKMVHKESLLEGREFDYEGSMARTQLFSIIKNSKALFDQIDDRTQLQGWVQSKLTKAEDYIDAVRTYLEGESLSTTTPLVVSEEMMKDEEGASLNIGDVVKAGDGGIYQVIFSYMEGKPFLVPFDLKKRKPTNLRNRIYFDSDSIVVRKLHKVMPFSATKGGFMK